MKLRDILGVVRNSYCRTVGIEYMHIQDPDQRKWLQAKLEVPYAKTSPDEQLRIVRRLNAAEAFETFLQTKFVGQKRFSLEGGESVIALLDRILCRAAGEGLDEVCIGMPHRGRLNVLANIAGKSYGQIFREFEGNLDPGQAHGSGDVSTTSARRASTSACSATARPPSPRPRGRSASARRTWSAGTSRTPRPR
jgi:2-oxoglutarate dehydrogenase E1 component